MTTNASQKYAKALSDVIDGAELRVAVLSREVSMSKQAIYYAMKGAIDMRPRNAKTLNTAINHQINAECKRLVERIQHMRRAQDAYNAAYAERYRRNDDAV